MKIYINYTKDPCIEVKINNDKDDDDKSYFDFIEYFKMKYITKTDFYFIFDLTNLNKPNLKLIYHFCNFMNSMKNKNKIQYLDFSIVINKNPIINNILFFIWSLYPPLNTIYIVESINLKDQLLNTINNSYLDESFLKSFILTHNILQI